MLSFDHGSYPRMSKALYYMVLKGIFTFHSHESSTLLTQARLY